MHLATSVFLRKSGACFQEEGQPEDSTLKSVTPRKSAFPHELFSLSVSTKQIRGGNKLSQNYVKKSLFALGFIAQSANMYFLD